MWHCHWWSLPVDPTLLSMKLTSLLHLNRLKTWLKNPSAGVWHRPSNICVPIGKYRVGHVLSTLVCDVEYPKKDIFHVGTSTMCSMTDTHATCSDYSHRLTRYSVPSRRSPWIPMWDLSYIKILEGHVPRLSSQRHGSSYPHEES